MLDLECIDFCTAEMIVVLNEVQTRYYERGVSYVKTVNTKEAYLLVEDNGKTKRCLLKNFINTNKVPVGITIVNCDGVDNLINTEDLFKHNKEKVYVNT